MLVEQLGHVPAAVVVADLDVLDGHGVGLSLGSTVPAIMA